MNSEKCDCNKDFFINIFRGKKVYEPPRYMSVNEAVKQLLEIPKTRDLKGEEPGTRKAGNPQEKKNGLSAVRLKVVL